MGRHGDSVDAARFGFGEDVCRDIECGRGFAEDGSNVEIRGEMSARGLELCAAGFLLGVTMAGGWFADLKECDFGSGWREERTDRCEDGV